MERVGGTASSDNTPEIRAKGEEDFTRSTRAENVIHFAPYFQRLQ